MRPSRFFPNRPSVFGGCQSSVSMTIQERSLNQVNEKQLGNKFSAEYEKILREVSIFNHALTILCISNR